MSGAVFEASAATAFLKHVARVQTGIAARIEAWFPNRQILIRGPGNFTSLNISQRQQMLAAGIAMILLGWSITTTLGLALACQTQIADDIAKRQLKSAIAQSQGVIEAYRQQNRLLVQERDQEVAAADAARDQAVARASAVIAVYNQKLSLLNEKTQGAISQVETIIKSTGLNPQSLAPSQAASETAANQPGPRVARPTATLLQDLSKLHSLADLLAQLPLAAPLAFLSVSSPFGFRPDPWTGLREFHVGIDLRGPVGTPVSATAPGIVTFAGVQTGYGNIVIIDHGFGLSTRYSHLSKILVTVGADVDLHQVIGLLGNTGWSTGPHLLYETRVDGQPRDPLDFIKVNRNGVQN